MVALNLLVALAGTSGSTVDAATPWRPAQAPLTTPWTAHVTAHNAWPEHPRPMMVRNEQSWQSLNGLWEIDYEASPDALDKPAPRATLPHQILVPFPLESALGGLRVQAPNYTTIYRRVFPSILPQCGMGSMRLLHFEKVDWNTTVWVNGTKVCSHTGGYDPFSCPLPTATTGGDAVAPVEIAVGVVDYTEKNPNHWQPEGKQVRSAFTEPSGMMYTGSSGIWDSVWAECVSAVGFVASTNFQSQLHNGVSSPDPSRSSSVAVEVLLGGADAGNATICLEIFDGDAPFRCQHQTCCLTSHQRKASPYVGILSVDMPSDAKLWSPDAPFLYNATVTLFSGGTMDPRDGTYLGGGAIVDAVHTYFGHRTVSTGMVDGVPRVLLNGKPCVLAVLK